MKKHVFLPAAALVGMAYAALTLILSQYLLRHLSDVLRCFGGPLNLDSATLSYATQVLDQLNGASIASPWLTALLLGALGGVLVALTFRRFRHAVWLVPLLLFVPLLLAALWFTNVNGVLTGALIVQLLPILPVLF